MSKYYFTLLCFCFFVSLRGQEMKKDMNMVDSLPMAKVDSSKCMHACCNNSSKIVLISASAGRSTSTYFDEKIEYRYLSTQFFLGMPLSSRLNGYLGAGVGTEVYNNDDGPVFVPVMARFDYRILNSQHVNIVPALTFGYNFLLKDDFYNNVRINTKGSLSAMAALGIKVYITKSFGFLIEGGYQLTQGETFNAELGRNLVPFDRKTPMARFSLFF